MERRIVVGGVDAENRVKIGGCFGRGFDAGEKTWEENGEAIGE